MMDTLGNAAANKLLSLRLLALILLAHFAGAAAAATGCLVRSKERLVIDNACVCLKTKTCATGKQAKYDKDFFHSPNAKKQRIFSGEEERLLKDSYETFNAIMELKSRGESRGTEIQQLYVRLAGINADLAKIQKNDHDRLARKIAAKKHRSTLASGDAKFEAELRRLSTQTDAPSALATSAPASAAAAQAPQPSAVASATGRAESAPLPTAEDSPDDLSAGDRAHILRHIDKKTTEEHPDDSLFDIISKAYLKNAYRRFLSND